MTHGATTGAIDDATSGAAPSPAPAPASPAGLPPLVEIRRHLHAHPELGWAEHATTAYVAGLLRGLGLTPVPLATGVGLRCDITADPHEAGGVQAGAAGGPLVLLRADLDALPLSDGKDVPYASTVAGVCHACGHDAHTTALLGAAADLAAEPPRRGRVRLLFQPAEELMPGGAETAIQEGVLEGVDTAFALHCDPTLDVGSVGVRVGALTAAADTVEVVLRGPGGHTSRPQNTVDLVYALAHVVTSVPAALSRLVDPRASLSLVWGAVSAGAAANAIPREGHAMGTVRTFSVAAWEQAPDLIRAAVEHSAALFGARAEVTYVRGVPPVVNDAHATELLSAAVEAVCGPGGAVDTGQSLGGEDFGWICEAVPGAMARLGTRTPGGITHDLHQSGFDIDERCLAIGAAVLAAVARAALA